ncbi:YjgB family protein [Caproiciproducens faecalis]|uniref:YjgB family protein n=1 Tax=Caproiciproducens faecalis TaxID=2820301 RepID=A0ABS7DKA7_9FIRM|nr:YjgB family protein [Caproiciproducens faecalis]MBW7571536.1 YjgB family protein [Caproiciproducens faecalis]
MTFNVKRTLAACACAACTLAVMTGCSNFNSSGSSQAPSSVPATSQTVSSAASEASSAAASSQPIDAQATLLKLMKETAEKGKVINCDFAVQSNVIEDVQEKWGKEDQSEYISAAKGTYATYSKKGFVFGFNKGSQLFEVRSFDSQLKGITLSKTEEIFGKPDYDVTSGKDRIIGYVVSKDYKMLMVFPNPKASGEDAVLDHYSVFYPAGTVNMMADDHGRQW